MDLQDNGFVVYKNGIGQGGTVAGNNDMMTGKKLGLVDNIGIVKVVHGELSVGKAATKPPVDQLVQIVKHAISAVALQKLDFQLVRGSWSKYVYRQNGIVNRLGVFGTVQIDTGIVPGLHPC